MRNTIKRIFKSIFEGIRTALLAGIYAIGIAIVCSIIHEENWLFTLALIIIAFFSSIYYYNKE